MILWPRFVVVFGLVAALDVSWALCAKFLPARKAVAIAVAVALIYAMMCAFSPSWLSDPSFIWGTLMGSVVGAFAVVRCHK